MPLFIDSAASARVEQDAANCLTIGLINNMPDAAVEATERQFAGVLREATANTVVLLKLFAIPELPRGDDMRHELAARYRDIAELWDTPLDGLIVTGAEPRADSLRDEPYWGTMTKVADWAKGNTASTIWSCLAAHAAVLHADGVERRALKQKLCGVFECGLGDRHPMTWDFPLPQWIPHSRYNGLPERALTACGYRVLTRSATAGVDSFAKQDGSFFLFFQGHPEYDADTLLREYRRDIACFLAGERADYPALPFGYFDHGTASVANGFRARALAARRESLIADFPKNILEAGVKCPWRPAAVGLYQRWAAYLSARKAERPRATFPRRRTWRDWPIGRPAAGSR